MKFKRKMATHLTAVTLALTTVSAFAATDLTGAGGTFPAPVYSRWAADYYKANGSKVNYQGIGSSGGVKQIIAKTVDFGASDAPMSAADLEKNGLFQFPTVIGGVVLAVNLPGIKSGQLILDGKTTGDIYLGKITRWNDPEIAVLNPGLKLPATNINVVRRADGSGTSFVFTSYLAKVNQEWNSKIGKGNTVNWPIGLGGKGNDGVAAFVQRLPGSIGYVEYAYAKQNNLTYTKLVDAAGKAIAPNEQSFSDAAKGANWQQSFAQDLTYQAGDNAWPISSTTYVLVYKKPANADKAKAVLQFFDYGYQQGAKTANSLDYAALPESVVTLIRDAWKKTITTEEGKAIYP
ncbi:phosphate ABC transporter substrate-binding protein PstS [Rosenbergiella nectarea]|uniref:phosphate ABC transporter substrate-binding protein PstS n=1 Tax=Rosenbergiella nectarea TaxID=988801 RepID=UPI001BD9B697|nr:phosphate ABC transporter substrate-binding protein PstS [Rosenbergiella nectarea]MBT0730799.1 phosphate ABC transporter substrate-binding protein PstS [Rosenbergiella nectarea subsp. apis]